MLQFPRLGAAPVAFSLPLLSTSVGEICKFVVYPRRWLSPAFLPVALYRHLSERFAISAFYPAIQPRDEYSELNADYSIAARFEIRFISIGWIRLQLDSSIQSDII